MPAVARSGLSYAPIDRDRRAIVQAFLHGLGDLPLNIAIVLPVTAWLACFTALNILVKALSFTVSTGGLFERALAMAKSPTLYVAGVLYVACALLYFISLTRLPLSTAGPVFMILGVVASAVIGSSVFGESLSLPKLLGMIVCLAGVGLIFYDTVR
jgi:multidrug transporter EmrE-like cation transporter